jgi:hypothetical protein
VADGRSLYAEYPGNHSGEVICEHHHDNGVTLPFTSFGTAGIDDATRPP